MELTGKGVKGVSVFRMVLRPAASPAEPYGEVIAAKGRTFAFAAALLPARVRRDVTLLYAFCRHLDDLADEGGSAEHEVLRRWQRWLQGEAPAPDAELGAAISDLTARTPGLAAPLAELAAALVEDTYPQALQREDDLDRYCHGVAGTVGIAMALVLGVREAAALAAADALGRAMQRTNVLRDIAEDLARGRCYLPRESLAAAGLEPDDLRFEQLRGLRRSSFEALLAAQSARARRDYARGLRGIAYVPPDCRLGITAAAYAYRAILDEVERLGVNVLRIRASTTRWTKMRLALQAWYDLSFGELS